MPETPSPKPQVDKFRDLARELDCDDDQARFDEKLKKLATQPPTPAPKARKGD
jgi:hypothetical protein